MKHLSPSTNKKMTDPPPEGITIITKSEIVSESPKGN